MPPVVVENPILNSPFHKPSRHLEMINGRVTGAVFDGRRASAHIEPVPTSRQGRGQQPDLDFDEADFTRRGNALVNQIRRAVDARREGGYCSTTPTTRRLLDHWTEPTRDRRLPTTSSRPSRPPST
jgi:type III restriction enzyme